MSITSQVLKNSSFSGSKNANLGVWNVSICPAFKTEVLSVTDLSPNKPEGKSIAKVNTFVLFIYLINFLVKPVGFLERPIPKIASITISSNETVGKSFSLLIIVGHLPNSFNLL